VLSAQGARGELAARLASATPAGIRKSQSLSNGRLCAAIPHPKEMNAMNINFESELMENQKHAVVMSPDLAFDVLQSQDGDALFFSIGTDNVFYLTREVTASSTGWNKLDLSSALSSQHNGAAVAAKTFAVAQNAQTLAIDLALVITVGGADFLYLSLGNANTDADWASGVTWTYIAFDAGTAPTPLTIADAFVMNLSAVGATGAVENIFVDIFRKPGDALKLLDRYYIAPGGSPQWNPHDLAADLAAGSISSCLGRRTNDPLPGIYTFGAINGEQELIFTPQYNYFKPSVPPSPARLTLPAGASAIASALNGSGVSNLFVAASDGLYLFTPANQGDQATSVQIIPNGIVAGASSLAAATDATRTAVWGIDPQSNLFYTVCPAGSEATPAAWSNPVSLLPQVEEFAFYLNLHAGNHVLFANINGQNLIQLTQDPVTTDWLQRSILLPSTSTSDVSVYNSFTTHIQITDDNGVAAPNAAVAVTATSPVSVYMNDVYYRLSPTVPVNTTADATGVLTVLQETQSLAAVCFRVTLTDSPQTVADINPMSKALATLSAIQTGDDLSNVQVTNADGSQQPLVPTSVSANDKDAAAQSIAQFVKINAGLPQDGSRQGATAAPSLRLAVASATAASMPSTWGIAFTKDGLIYHEGEPATARFAMAAPAAGDSAISAGIGSAIEIAAGDFFRWVQQVFDDVESFVVQEEEGLYHFLATIAGQVYDVALDCLTAVAHAVEFVLNKIEVFFDDLIKWLGFLFQWSDILRTHGVLKNIFNQYLAKCINGLGDARTQLQNSFSDAQNYVDQWAGIPNNIPPSLSGSSLNSATASSQPVPGQNSPQSNWGIYHLKSNAAAGTTTAQPNPGVLGDLESILQPLLDALQREKDAFQAAYTRFKSDVIDQIHELSFEKLIEAVMAIIADALLQSIENVLLAAIDVLVALTAGALDGLNATIDIPVISWVYTQVTGNEMSLLDITCLVAAIPITIGYKLIADAAPFPDDATTAALISAPDFATIQSICNPAQAMAATSPSRMAMASTAVIAPADNRIVVLTGGIASAYGAVLQSYCSPLKQKFPDVPIFPIVGGLSYLLYASPDIMGQIPDLLNKKWWAIFNEILTGLMAIKTTLVDMCMALAKKDPASKTGWDMASPWLDFAGNTLWEVPTVAAIFDSENQNTPGILNLWAGTCFDCNGIMSPALAIDSEPITWAALVALATFFNLGYGAMSCAASALTFKATDGSTT
jgi:hypothetical protein